MRGFYRPGLVLAGFALDGDVMRAQELVQEVEKAQRELRLDIAELVQAKINHLSEATGLYFYGVSCRLTETTSFSSEYREWAVSDVEIDYSLPPMVSME